MPSTLLNPRNKYICTDTVRALIDMSKEEVNLPRVIREVSLEEAGLAIAQAGIQRGGRAEGKACAASYGNE